MVVAAIIGYLLGSIPTAQIVARIRGVDPLHEGDGNPGWWNMRGLVGERAAAFVLVADVAKGVLAAILGSLIWGDIWWTAYVAVAFAVLGHAFSAFAYLRGGKGVLTWSGGMFVLSPLAGCSAIALGIVVGGVCRLFGRRIVWAPRVAFFAFPVAQAFVDPRARVAVTGVMMIFIGLRFLVARVPAVQTPSRAKSVPDATSSV